MKNTIKFMIGLLAIGLVSCEPEFENAVTDEGFYDAGDADFSNYVSLGNSLTAGYADGALYRSGQEDSYPNIMAEQFGFVGGGDFTQPLTSDNLGGLLLGGQQILGNRLVLSADENGNPFPTPLDGTPTTDVTTSEAGPFNNMGVPGAKSYHLVTPGYGSVAGVANGTANPWYARFATSESSTVLADAASLNPTFFSLWIGNNDILGYATSGGSGVDQTGNLDPSTYGGNDITDPNVFAAAYSAQVDALVAGGAKGVLLNIPDVTSIPYFTTVPPRSIPLDAATADLLNGGFAAYNGGLAAAQAFGLISAEEVTNRTITFVEGLNAVTMEDEYLTNLSSLGLPSWRQATMNDKIVLPAIGLIGTTVDGNPTQINGVSVPLADGIVLSYDEIAETQARTVQFNATIETITAQQGWALYDAYGILNQAVTQGVAFDDYVMTTDLVFGGFFSLDGVHTTARGSALIANGMMEAIDAHYGSNLSDAAVKAGDYPTNYSPNLR